MRRYTDIQASGSVLFGRPAARRDPGEAELWQTPSPFQNLHNCAGVISLISAADGGLAVLLFLVLFFIYLFFCSLLSATH